MPETDFIMTVFCVVEDLLVSQDSVPDNFSTAGGELVACEAVDSGRFGTAFRRA